MTYLFRVFSPKRHNSFREKAYNFWNNIWQETMKGLGEQRKLYADPFVDADEVSVIIDSESGDIIAMHVYNYHNLYSEAEVNRKALQMYPETAWSMLKDRDVKCALSLEWMCVSSEHRKTINGSEISKVLLGLSMEVFKNSIADVALGVTYNKRKVNELAFYFGAEQLINNAKVYGVEVSYVAFYKEKIRLAEDLMTARMIRLLWEEYSLSAGSIADTIKRSA